MNLDKIAGALNNDTKLCSKFGDNLEKLWDFDIKLKRELPENTNESIAKINQILEFCRSKDKFLWLKPDWLISMQRELVIHLWFLAEIKAFYSVEYSRSLIFRRVTKSALSLSLRRISKSFAEVLENRLTNDDVANMSDLSTIEEFEEELYCNYVSEYLKNLSKAVYELSNIINNRLTELRYERKNTEKL